jgi:hypothetical protein
MNVAFFNEFGRTNPTLPLKEAGKIVQGNATRLDWEAVCPKEEDNEIYILGNPPYQGARKQSKEQKKDINYIFKESKGSSGLDYICCWFLKSAGYASGSNVEIAFVSTNSICQGEQVAFLWPHIFQNNIEIHFCHQAFRWQNNAKNKAVVAVIIVGLRNKSNKLKYIFKKNHKRFTKNISPYLTENSNLIIEKRRNPFSSLPNLVYGNQAIDKGYLELTNEEKGNLIKNHPESVKYIKRLYGGNDFLKGILRWCIWVKESELENAEKIPLFKERFKKVYDFRLNGGEVARSLVNIPYRFRYVHEPTSSLLILPKVTSEKREYLTVDFVSANSIALQTLQVIYDSDPFIFGVLSSKMHIIWVKAVAGGMKTDLVYSNSLCYNAYPFPKVSKQRKNEITQSVFRILGEREKHSDKTLAQLYDPDKMPEGLRAAHRQNDEIIEKCYRPTPFNSDEERLEYLFKLYEKMIAEEQAQGTLFAKPKKTRKKKK